MVCPHEPSVRALAGSSPDALPRPVATHLAACESCRQLFARGSAEAARPAIALDATAAPSPSTSDTVAPDVGSAATLAPDVAMSETLASAPTSPSLHGGLARGATVGRYVVIDVLGKGGMGVVYAAFDPELDRKVAMKLLHPELVARGGADAAARLLREGRAIAKLSHPNVVTVHDVGTTHDGAVFVAMELVEGSSLDHWIAEKPRPWREVVEVFAQAGAGLVAAHAAGMVHRDFKPANVLMGRDGRVRVTDFGLARFENQARATDAGLAPRRDDAIALTQAGALVGTPAYMAAEQFAGDPVDATTDQFSFAVALYEGLYRERPFAGSSLAEIAANVTDGAVRPAPANTTVPARLRQIVLRALRPAREERYPALQDLLDALRAALRRRGRLYLAAGAAAVAMAGATAGATTMLARHDEVDPCGGGDAKLAGIWDPFTRSNVERAFLATGAPYAPGAWRSVATTLDGYTDAWLAKRHDTCEATSVRREQSVEALDLRMSCLDQHLAGLAAKVEVLASADADVVQRAPFFAQPPPLDECDDLAALRDPVALPPQPIRAEVDSLRRRTEHAKALQDAGKVSASATELAPVLDRATGLGFKPLLAEALLLRGDAEAEQGDIPRAEATYHEALVTALAGNQQRIITHASIGLMKIAGLEKTSYDKALEYGAQAEAVALRVAPNGKLEADVRHYRGVVYLYKGDYTAARSDLERALAIYQRLYGPESLLSIDSLAMLGSVERQTGRADRALEINTRVIAIMEKQFGTVHPDLARLYANKANALETLHRLDEAREVARHALAIAEVAFGPTHRQTGVALYSLGRLENKLHDTASALSLLARARAILEVDAKTNASWLGRLAATEGSLRFSIGDYEGADAVNTRAAELEDPIYPALHEVRASRLYQTGRIKMRLGQLDAARSLLERAADMQSKLQGSAAKTDVVYSLSDLARVERLAGHLPRAHVHAARAAELAATLGDDGAHATALEQLGEVELATGALDRARTHFERALELEQKAYGPDSADIDVAIVGLGATLQRRGDLGGATAAFERALKVLANEPEGGPSSQNRAAAALHLAEILHAAPATRTRALELARTAERLFGAGGPMSAPRHDAAVAWLRAHAPGTSTR